MCRLPRRRAGPALVPPLWARQQHKLAARKDIAARWAWSCDDPRTLESLGLEVVQEAAATRPPPELRRRLPRLYRYALPLASRIAGDLATVTLFRVGSR